MYPIRHNTNNTLYRSPEGEKPMGDLPVTATADGMVIYSFWQPSEQDIANILAGVPIRLGMMGGLHPPVSIEVTNSVE